MDTISVAGLLLKAVPFTPRCAAEEQIPPHAAWCAVENGRVFGIRRLIGKEEHPFPWLCEAAVYQEGCWLIGVDHQKNCFFSPVWR